MTAKQPTEPLVGRVEMTVRIEVYIGVTDSGCLRLGMQTADSSTVLYVDLDPAAGEMLSDRLTEGCATARKIAGLGGITGIVGTA